MLLTFDIGNTNITLGGYIADRLEFEGRLSTDTSKTADQYAVDIINLVNLKGFKKEDITDAVICSVVPSALTAVKRAMKFITGVEPTVLGPGTKTGLNIKIDNPAQLGADLVAGAIGSIGKYPTPTILIDLGTATTISVLNKNGDFIGCSIAAGVRSTLNALTSKTAQLPAISLEAPKSVIGKNTADSMKSGLVIGAAAMLDGMIDRIEDEIGEKTTVVATGGRAEAVIENCRHEIILDNYLLLDGLIKFYHKNKT